MSLTEDRELVVRALAAYNNMSVADYERMLDIFAKEFEKLEWATRAFHLAKMQKEFARDRAEEWLNEIRNNGRS